MQTLVNKEIDGHADLYPLIRNRWSPRSFSKDPISDEQLEIIFKAAASAFSANNMQPWRYAYAHKGSEAFDRLVEALMPGNQPWAKNAAVLMVSFAAKVNDNGQPNPWSQHDLGAANATMTLQALSMDIYLHLMAGFDPAKAAEVAGIDSERWQAVAMIAMGYQDAADQLQEPYLARELAPRSRKSPDEFATKL